MKHYKCEMPNCNYQTNDRHKIHKHHINPRENKGNNKKYNLIYLCPNHHTNIKCKESKRGIHSKENDFEIIAWRNNRTILEYIENKEYKFYNYLTKEILICQH